MTTQHLAGLVSRAAVAVVLAAMLLATARPAHAQAQPAADIASADLAYETQHYREALALYERAAADGDRRAQEVAGLMLFCGETLYGEAVQRDKVRAAQWFAKAAAQGSPMAKHMLRRLEKIEKR